MPLLSPIQRPIQAYLYPPYLSTALLIAVPRPIVCRPTAPTLRRQYSSIDHAEEAKQRQAQVRSTSPARLGHRAIMQKRLYSHTSAIVLQRIFQ